MKQTLDRGIPILLNLEQSVSRSGTQLLADCAVALGGEVSSFLSFSWWVRGLPIFSRFSSELFGFAFFYQERLDEE